MEGTSASRRYTDKSESEDALQLLMTAALQQSASDDDGTEHDLGAHRYVDDMNADAPRYIGLEQLATVSSGDRKLRQKKQKSHTKIDEYEADEHPYYVNEQRRIGAGASASARSLPPKRTTRMKRTREDASYAPTSSRYTVQTDTKADSDDLLYDDNDDDLHAGHGDYEDVYEDMKPKGRTPRSQRSNQRPIARKQQRNRRYSGGSACDIDDGVLRRGVVPFSATVLPVAHPGPLNIVGALATDLFAYNDINVLRQHILVPEIILQGQGGGQHRVVGAISTQLYRQGMELPRDNVSTAHNSAASGAGKPVVSGVKRKRVRSRSPSRGRRAQAAKSTLISPNAEMLEEDEAATFDETYGSETEAIDNDSALREAFRPATDES